VLFEREEDAEEGGFGEVGAGADVLEGERGFAVEAVQDFERAADGTEVVLVAGRGIGVGLEGPFWNAATHGFFYGECLGFSHELGCRSPGES